MSLRTVLSIHCLANLMAPSPLSGGARHEIGGQIDLLSGTADGEADLVLLKEYVLAASGTQVVDLVGLLTDAFGSTFTAAELVGLFVEITSGTGVLHFGPDATAGVVGWWNAAADKEVLSGVGSRYGKYMKSGVALAAASSDELYFAETGGSAGVTFHLLALGRSA